MASLRKVPGCNNWIACFTDKDGIRRQRSTGSKDRREAQKTADRYEEVSRKKRTARQTRTVIADLHRAITGECIQTLSFREYAESWLTAKRPETAPSTATFYENAITKFTDTIGPKADSEIVDIAKADVLAFRNAEVKSFAPRTVNHDLKVIRMIFRAARSEGVVSEDPAEFVKTVKLAHETGRRAFTLPEVRSVLSVADDEWKSMILFGLYSGQRLGDIAKLTWANLDLQAGELRLVTSKTGKTIIQPLAGPLKSHIELLTVNDDPNAPIHPRAFDIVVRQKKSGGLSNQFASLLSQAGLREKVAHRKTHGEGRGVGSSTGGLSFHCLRHTAVSLLKEAGIPAAVVMELVGHDSKAMSDHYTHVGSESLRKTSAVSSRSPLPARIALSTGALSFKPAFLSAASSEAVNFSRLR